MMRCSASWRQRTRARCPGRRWAPEYVAVRIDGSFHRRRQRQRPPGFGQGPSSRRPARATSRSAGDRRQPRWRVRTPARHTSSRCVLRHESVWPLVPLRCTSACGFTRSRATLHEHVPGEGKTPGAILASKKRHESAGPGTDVDSLADRRQVPARLLSGTRPAHVSSQTSVSAHEAGVGGGSAFLAFAMAASAITRHDRLSATTTAVQ